MKSAVLFVDTMEISWHRVQESHCTRQQNTTHLDHTERQLRGSYCYGFDNNGDDIHHICKNAEILEQKHTSLVKKGKGLIGRNEPTILMVTVFFARRPRWNTIYCTKIFMILITLQCAKCVD